ncbi:MAG: RNA polymerase sigma factor [Bacteroidetes bacterium]|nr:RNA polymerase sigma factor [Bacteroidota bacterium]MBK9798706.1 RNA polymerase sigma factor [Bacteroidota bacterium]MBP6413767.1 RNA polymerase sigma factor [Bacteroidia bacterium]
MTIDQFTKEFESARSQLKSYLLRITASIDDSEDIIQDTFIKASLKLDTFRAESSVKTWIFTIASNIAKDNLRAKKRWPETVTDICREKALTNPDYFPEIAKLMQSSPQTEFEIKEHITFCLTCIAKSLPLEQQICLLLKEIYDFKVAEISEILETTEAMVKYYLHTSRSKMVNIYEGRCALINKEGTCHQCSELNGIFNPKQDFEVEKNKIEFAKKAKDPNREQLLDLRFKIMKEIDPFKSKGAILQLHHIQHNRQIMEEFSEKNEN